MKLVIEGRPIAKKNSRNIGTRYGRIFNRPSDAYEDFEENTIQQLIDSGLTKITGITEKRKNIYTSNYLTPGEVFIHYVFYKKGNMIIDPDNAEAGINDILQTTGLIENDKKITHHYNEMIPGNTEWRTEVYIYPASQIQVSLIGP